ncbi:PREDICTED: pollen-specific leucine-rich repeat extensin-like protein 1 [Ipomoea nil]|uniref:pollen-specific leucine-rich repeat extensin-like protein 1 n=1 Tax=Ipomoea nil TaxID=35883 RepID=UPI000901C248|nr:PREDICTED: pollen-specific leucine-rich repeat extensin-like protein 1 [Ipomoea nil]
MMHRASLNMLASSNGGRKRKAPEGHREMTHSPPPQGFPITRNQRAGAGACFGAPAPRFPTPQRQMPSPPRRFSTPQRQMPSPPRRFSTPQRQMPSPPRRFPTPPQQMMAPPPLPPLNLQLHLEQPEASSSRAPAPLLPTPPPLNLHFRLDQPEEASSSRAPPPYFDTVLRLSVTPHAQPQTEQGFKEDAPPPANPNLHKDFIDQALKRNNDGVREMLEEMCKRQYAAVVTAAEEKAAKKLKEMDEEIVEVRTKNGELEAMLASYRTQAMDMAERLTALKETNAALNAALHEATHRRGSGGGDGAAAAEEAQSSSLDPDQMVVVRISCKVCWRGPATMMAWPCRHLCMCNNCARTTNCCPICNATFQDGIEIKFY